VCSSDLVAEVKARNSGTNVVTTEQLGQWLFDDPYGKNIKLTISDPGAKRSVLGGAIQSVEDWLKNFLGSFFSGVISFLANLVTGGNLEPYFINVFNKDIFYGAKVDAEVKTLLPAEAYAWFAGASSFPTTQTVSATVYMPGLDSCKYTGQSFIASILDWMHDHLGL
jgi:hypothetical protein